MNPEIARWRQRAANNRAANGGNDPNADYCDRLADDLEAAEAERERAAEFNLLKRAGHE